MLAESPDEWRGPLADQSPRPASPLGVARPIQFRFLPGCFGALLPFSLANLARHLSGQ